MRVVHLVAPGPVGGVERLVVAGVGALEDAGVDVVVTVLVDGRCPRHGEGFIASMRAAGVRRVARWDVRGRLDPWAVLVLRRRLREARPDVVHVHGYKPLFYALAARAGVPIVLTHHGRTSVDARVRFYEALARRMARGVAAVVAVAAAGEAELLADGLPRARVHRIPNCLTLAAPPERLRAPTAHTTRLAVVGRLSREKGVDVLIEAMGRATAPLALDVVGDGDERAALEARAAALGLDVVFHGFVSDVGPLLGAAAALVLPSRREALPLALIEAACWGKPVVASDVGGVPEIVRDGVTGLLVPPEDVAALARALDALHADRAGFEARAGAAAAELRDRYAPSRWAAATRALYDAVSSPRVGG